MVSNCLSLIPTSTHCVCRTYYLSRLTVWVGWAKCPGTMITNDCYTFYNSLIKCFQVAFSGYSVCIPQPKSFENLTSDHVHNDDENPCVKTTERKPLINLVICQYALVNLSPGCLKSGKPSTLVGDIFFTLTCASCSSDGSETCIRQNVSW